MESFLRMRTVRLIILGCALFIATWFLLPHYPENKSGEFAMNDRSVNVEREQEEVPAPAPAPSPVPVANAATPALERFLYTFNVAGTFYATTYMDWSTSPYFWISSGGGMVIKNGTGRTLQGPLPATDPQRINYATVNPLDTENGKYPENTFRLVTRKQWGNAEEKVQFRILKQILTNTPNRDGYSGIFLFSRYKDHDNLYYAGVRDDGLAIIKKKINGTYYTLTYKQVFGKAGTYNKTTNPSLIPSNKWIGMKTQTMNLANGSVRITLLLDTENSGAWKTVLTYTDSGRGGAPFTAKGNGGLRTDYMDVEFDNFEFQAL